MKLTPSQLREQLGHLKKRSEQKHGCFRLAAIHAEDWDEQITELEVDGESIRVAWCPSPLAICDRLAHLDEGDQLVVLTPVPEHEISEDVLARLQSRRVVRPDRWALVMDAYGVSQIDSRLSLDGAMADALLAARPSDFRCRTSVLDAGTAWRHLCEHFFALPGGAVDVHALLIWSRQPDAAVRWNAADERLRAATLERLCTAAGPLGTSLAGAIGAGFLADLLPLGLVCEVIFHEDATGNEALQRSAVRMEPRVGGHPLDPAFGRQWASLARRALAEDAVDRDAALGRAEALLVELHVADHAALSDTLHSGFRARALQFAEVGRRVLAGDAALELAESAWQLLNQHVLRGQNSQRLGHLQMVLRLLRRLTVSEDLKVPADLPAFLQLWREDFAFEDWARRHLIGGDPDPEVSSLFRQIHLAMRERREQINEAFAERLATSGDMVRPSGLTLIENGLEQVVAPVADAGPVLLLVLDGLDGGTFEELAASLAERGWSRQVRNEAPQALLAVLPTITECSRTALLTGKVQRGNQAIEREAFASQPKMRAASAGMQAPVLFHKASLTDAAAEGLSDEVRAALRNERQRIVGIVLNAVDDHLDKADQLQLSWGVESFRLLETILSTLRAAGRTLVITSDHGHVLDADSEKRQEEGVRGARWRTAEREPQQGEVRLEGARVRAAVGEDAVVLPWSERIRYTQRKNGYHGGISLQEAVVPVGVFTPPGQYLDGWSPNPSAAPKWWSRQDAIRPLRLPKPPTQESAQEPRTAKPQADLFVEPSVDATTDTVHGERWAALFASPTYQAQRRLAGRTAPDDALVEKALDALVDAHGALSAAAFGRALGLKPLRVRGAIANLMRLLNVDAFPVLRHDPAADRLELDTALLLKQFELPHE